MSRNNRIYHEGDIVLNRSQRLDDQAATHVARVLRMRAGQRLTLFNGRGGEFQAQLETVQKRQVTVFVEQYDDIERESSLKIHLGQALVRGERMDYAIQKAVEIGVSDIHPINTQYSGVQLNSERLQSRYKHWQQIIISACEQCGRNRLPQLHPLREFADWLAQCQGQGWILQAGDYHQPALRLENEHYVAIGPEGGFADEELQLADQHGFQRLSLGRRILRTETAGVVAAAHLQCVAGIMD